MTLVLSISALWTQIVPSQVCLDIYIMAFHHSYNARHNDWAKQSFRVYIDHNPCTLNATIMRLISKLHEDLRVSPSETPFQDLSQPAQIAKEESDLAYPARWG